MIRVEGLRKHFGSNVAVDGVSFEVRPGEVFGLLGPNGAGKTTTISMMVGALAPDAGSVRIGDHGDPLKGDHGDPRKPETRKAVGLAPQMLAIYDELTGEENLSFFGRLYHLSGPRLSERIQWALNLAGLADRRKDAVRTYSGGMKRRLNIACGLVHEPRVVFLDEPTVGVDPQSRNYIFDSVERLKAGGLTVVYTTHYMEEAQRLCDRVAIMDRGRILALNTVDGLVKEHGGSSLVTAEFEGEPVDQTALGGEMDGTQLRIQTSEPFKEVARLAQSGMRIASLHVDRPDLEAVFLSLTGRSLRD